MPLVEIARARGVEYFPAGPDTSAESYYIERNDDGNYVHEINAGNLAGELNGLWSKGDLPEIAELALTDRCAGRIYPRNRRNAGGRVSFHLRDVLAMNLNPVKKLGARVFDAVGINSLGYFIQRAFFSPFIRIVNYHNLTQEMVTQF